MSRIVTINYGATGTSYSTNNGNTWTAGYSGDALVSTYSTGTHGQPASNPLVYANGNYVLVGPSKACVSADGVSWTTYSSQAWSGAPWLVHTTTAFVLVASGTTYSSTNGSTWTTLNTTLNSNFSVVRDVITNGPTILVVGAAITTGLPRSAISVDDGVTWSIGTSFTTSTSNFMSVCWTGTKYLGFVYDTAWSSPGASFMVTSTDGLTWTRSPSPLATAAYDVQRVYRVASNGCGVVMAIGSATSGKTHWFYVSTDSGSNWVRYSFAGDSFDWRNLFFDGQNFIAAADTEAINGRVAVTRSEITGIYSYTTYPIGYSNPVGPLVWNQSTSITASPSITKSAAVAKEALLLSASTTLSKHLAVTATKTVISSPLITKGIMLAKWIQGTLPSITKGLGASKLIIAQRSIGLFVSNMQWHVISTLQASRSVVRTSSKFFGKIWSMLYNGALWVGVKNNSKIAASSVDGANWTTRALTKTRSWNGIATNGTTIIALACNSDVANVSADGLTWEEHDLPATRAWSAIASDGTKFVAIALDSIMASVTSDGVIWTEAILPVKANWTSIAWNGTVFCAITDTDVAATSTDGVTWSQQELPNNVHYNCITWHLGQFTAIADGTNLAARSEDGVTWSTLTMPAVANWAYAGPGIGDPNA